MKNFQLISSMGTKIEGKIQEFPIENEKKGQDYIDFIFIHAFPFDLDMYMPNFKNQNLISEFNQIAQKQGKIRVFLPNLPGFGKSEPLNSQPNDLLPYVTVISDIVKKYQISNLVLGGCSMGGYIILEYTARNIERVDGLILIDTRADADTEEQKGIRLNTIHAIKEVLKKNPKDRNKRTLLRELYDKYSEVAAFVDGLNSKIVSDEFIKKNPEAKEEILNLMLQQSVQGVIQALSGMAGRRKTTFVLKNFSKPILIVVGEEDKVTPEKTAKEMKKIAKTASLETIELGGHLSNRDNIREFNKILVRWTKKQL
ncbi:MAG: alpha/beta fold hydrolase [Candidatus Lokiarchaeota archaeon]|nr:alpha/beta fold hydrolase [Candidatus Lokiarchaeota archaeon]MBD3343336.1 alpha/beta fold hydrolase [Candidatus Lokiarchaeota archaeon]